MAADDFAERAKAARAELQLAVARGAGSAERSELPVQNWKDHRELAAQMRAAIEAGDQLNDAQVHGVELSIDAIDEVIETVAANVTALEGVLTAAAAYRVDGQAEILRQQARIMESQVAGLWLAVELQLLADAWDRSPVGRGKD